MSYLTWFCVAALVLVAIPYVLGPLLILATIRFRYPAKLLFFDPDDISLPGDVAEFVYPACEALVSLGFEPVAYFCLPDVASTNSINVLLINSATDEAAMVNCIYAGWPAAPIKSKFVEFATRFRDGMSVQTSNTRDVDAFRHPPDDHTIHFSEVEDVAALYLRHQLICERLGTTRRELKLIDHTPEEVEQYLQTNVLKEPLDYQVQEGLFRRVDDEYRPTLIGAWLLTWQELWPLKALRRAASRRNAAMWFREIESDLDAAESFRR